MAYIELDAPLTARKWLEEMEREVASLAEMPRRCPVARESPLGGEELRQLTSGGYRVLFIIRESTVFVARIRHAKRADVTLTDVEQ